MERIEYGNDSWNLDLAGNPLSTVLAQYRTLFNIPVGVRVEVNGSQVGDSYVVKSGDRIECVRETGAKGKSLADTYEDVDWSVVSCAVPRVCGEVDTSLGGLARAFCAVAR